ncbi:MAG: hypothetical protein KAS71_14045, partial [Bacteroidales bacterium]|nr:hypothetical protein [Bacteroidales bacterium]
MKTKSLLITFVLSIILFGEILSQPRVPLIPDVEEEDQICFAMYTVQNNIMKMSAQLYPLDEEDSRIVRLEIKENEEWKEIAREKVNENSYNSMVDDARSWVVVFRIENWDSSKDVEYRVAH